MFVCAYMYLQRLYVQKMYTLIKCKKDICKYVYLKTVNTCKYVSFKKKDIYIYIRIYVYTHICT